MKYEHLLLDLDGTLLGSRSTSLQWRFIFQFLRSLRKNGIPVWRGIQILDAQKKKMLEASHQFNKIPNFTKACSFFSELSGLSPEKSTQILGETSQACFEFATPAFFQITQALDFLSWARPRYKLALATNPMWTREVENYRLKLAGISPDIFEFITDAENMSACKPHVQYYQELLQLWSLDPKKCIMVGNDEVKDGPARNVGIETFIIQKYSDFSLLRQKLESSL